MINKSVSTRSIELLSFFRRKGQNYFNYIEATKVFKQWNNSLLGYQLRDMVKSGLLLSIKKGVYYIIPNGQGNEIFIPNRYLLVDPLATSFTTSLDHYIAYYSAMNIHGLVSQPSQKEYIVIANRMRFNVHKIRNITYQFIRHNENHFFGFKNILIDNINKVFCSDLEKTIVDCLFNSSHAKGIFGVASAIYSCQDKIDFYKLLQYVKRFQTIAVSQRLGFLLEALEIDTSIISLLYRKRFMTKVYLDINLPKSGKLITKWNIVHNLKTKKIKSAILSAKASRDTKKGI